MTSPNWNVSNFKMGSAGGREEERTIPRWKVGNLGQEHTGFSMGQTGFYRAFTQAPKWSLGLTKQFVLV